MQSFFVWVLFTATTLWLDGVPLGVTARARFIHHDLPPQLDFKTAPVAQAPWLSEYVTVLTSGQSVVQMVRGNPGTSQAYIAACGVSSQFDQNCPEESGNGIHLLYICTTDQWWAGGQCQQPVTRIRLSETRTSATRGY